MPEKINQALRDIIDRVRHDDNQYETTIESWQPTPDQPSSETSLQDDESQFEALVQEAMRALNDDAHSELVGRRLRQITYAFPFPTLIISQTGKIIRMNLAAEQALDVLPGQAIDDMGYILENGQTISEQLDTAYRTSNSKEFARFVSANKRGASSTTTLALLQGFDKNLKAPFSIVFMVDSKWRGSVDSVISREFSLTSAELEIVKLFVDGSQLPEIAQARNSSLATVRKQFNSALKKVGANDQPDLVRRLLSLTLALQNLENVSTNTSNLYRRRLDLLHDDGRTSEVFISGDASGDVVVLVPSTTLRTFGANVERMFSKNRLCVISLCPPGYGASDPPQPGKSKEETYAEDLRSLLDQYGIKKAKVLGQFTSAVAALRLGSDAPDRVSEVILLSPVLPYTYLQGSHVPAPLISALINARVKSKTVFRLLVHLMLKAWHIGGVMRVQGKQLEAFAPDFSLIQQQEVKEEMDAAFGAQFAQGFEQGVLEIENVASDWSQEVSDCDVPITMLHGANDPTIPIDRVRKFCSDFASKISLIEVPNCGQLLVYSALYEFVAVLKNPVRALKSSAPGGQTFDAKATADK